MYCVPELASDDLVHPTPAASLGVAVSAKNIGAVRNSVALQDWNVRGESSFPQPRRAWWVRVASSARRQSWATETHTHAERGHLGQMMWQEGPEPGSV